VEDPVCDGNARVGCKTGSSDSASGVIDRGTCSRVRVAFVVELKLAVANSHGTPCMWHSSHLG
jgi:hypothetical protein